MIDNTPLITTSTNEKGRGDVDNDDGSSSNNEQRIIMMMMPSDSSRNGYSENGNHKELNNNERFSVSAGSTDPTHAPTHAPTATNNGSSSGKNSTGNHTQIITKDPHEGLTRRVTNTSTVHIYSYPGGIFMPSCFSHFYQLQAVTALKSTFGTFFPVLLIVLMVLMATNIFNRILVLIRMPHLQFGAGSLQLFICLFIYEL
jgi:hypothetical protein